MNQYISKISVIAALVMTTSALRSADQEACVPRVESEFKGKAIGITDGDTIRVLTEDHRAVSVRLEGIDAPEKGQEHGAKATAALKDLVGGREILIKKTGEDRYKRTLAYVYVVGLEVNQQLVEDGWAWHFTKYNCEERYATAEAEARKLKRGLWAHDRPMAPWDYRALKESKPAAAKAPIVAPISPPTPKLVAEPPAKPAVPTARYWLNTSSGVRHNSSCKHFGNTKAGRFCGPDDGKGCGICGG